MLSGKIIMRIQDIIRSVLDIIDQVDTEVEPQVNDQPDGYSDDDIARFKQIAGIVREPGEMSPLANSPNEKIADIDAVTTDAGGGLNGPKHPDDLRGNSVSIYKV